MNDNLCLRKKVDDDNDADALVKEVLQKLENSKKQKPLKKVKCFNSSRICKSESKNTIPVLTQISNGIHHGTLIGVKVFSKSFLLKIKDNKENFVFSAFVSEGMQKQPYNYFAKIYKNTPTLRRLSSSFDFSITYSIVNRRKADGTTESHIKYIKFNNKGV